MRHRPLPAAPLRQCCLALLGVAALVAWVPPASAQAVTCHLAYAGASRSFTIAPAAHGEPPAPQIEGASFAFEVVNRLPPEPGAGVEINTYGVFAGTPFLLHQARYAVPSGHTGPHGFTGLQVVREPVRLNELAYWCERAGR